MYIWNSYGLRGILSKTVVMSEIMAFPLKKHKLCFRMNTHVYAMTRTILKMKIDSCFSV